MLIFNAFVYIEPVLTSENRCNGKIWELNHSSGKRVLNLLKAIYLRLSKIAVVKFGVDDRGSDGTGCLSIMVRTDATKFTDVRIAELRK